MLAAVFCLFDPTHFSFFIPFAVRQLVISHTGQVDLWRDASIQKRYYKKQRATSASASSYCHSPTQEPITQILSPVSCQV
jgi:hypothetical protein